MSEEKQSKNTSRMFSEAMEERDAQVRAVAKFAQGGRRRRARARQSQPLRVRPLDPMQHVNAGSERMGITTSMIEHLRKGVMAKTFGVREFDQSVQTAIGGESPGIDVFGQGNSNPGLGRAGPGSRRAQKMNRHEQMQGSGLLNRNKK